mmetsp:Transcript_30802/g.45951  ORF Transcript_30802/g.45951 Transcript_30802/m.45951 type:complete len:80 (-) Transcript_30802:1266-1505(-)
MHKNDKIQMTIPSPFAELVSPQEWSMEDVFLPAVPCSSSLDLIHWSFSSETTLGNDMCLASLSSSELLPCCPDNEELEL